MSKIADSVFSCLQELFPHHNIIKEHYVNYKGVRLFFDFYIRDLGVLIECQGAQHTQFVKHYHGTRENFLSQKKRDNLKVEFIEDTHFVLVLFYDNIDAITPELVLDRVYAAQCREAE